MYIKQFCILDDNFNKTLVNQNGPQCGTSNASFGCYNKSERVILSSEQINVKKYSWKLPFHGASLWNKVIFGNS